MTREVDDSLQKRVLEFLNAGKQNITGLGLATENDRTKSTEELFPFLSSSHKFYKLHEVVCLDVLRTSSTPIRLSREDMKLLYRNHTAYEYLCRLYEAKLWLEEILCENLQNIDHFKTLLSNGSLLAKLAHFATPDVSVQENISETYTKRGYSQQCNMSSFKKMCLNLAISQDLVPSETDIINKQKISILVLCIHETTAKLYSKGCSRKLCQSVYGKVAFSDEDLQRAIEYFMSSDAEMEVFNSLQMIPMESSVSSMQFTSQVNAAILKEDSEAVLSLILKNDDEIDSVMPELIEYYMENFKKSLHSLKETAEYRSCNYERILNDAGLDVRTNSGILRSHEIQGIIKMVNSGYLIDELKTAVSQSNVGKIQKLLKNSFLNLQFVYDFNIGTYKEALANTSDNLRGRNHTGGPDCLRDLRSKLQKIILECNEKKEAKEDRYFHLVNRKLDEGDPKETLAVLKSLGNRIPSVYDVAATLYHHEMAFIKEDKMDDLSDEEIIGGVNLVNAVARVNFVLEENDPDKLMTCLSDPKTGLLDVVEENMTLYLSDLRKMKILLEDQVCPFLRYYQLQTAISLVNSNRQNYETDLILSLNEALDEQKIDDMWKLLEKFDIQDFKQQDNVRIFHILEKQKELLGTDLSVEDLRKARDMYLLQQATAEKLTFFMSQMNISLLNGDHVKTHELLRSHTISDEVIPSELIPKIIEDLLALIRKQRKNPGGEWITEKADLHTKVYINTMKGEFSWEKPSFMRSPPKALGMDDIKTVVDKNLKLAACRKKDIDFVVMLQAYCRGFLVRRNCRSRAKAATKIQIWWRGIRGHLQNKRKLECYQPQILIIQKAFRKWQQRKHLRKLIEEMKRYEKDVVIIQRAWRRYRARQDLEMLVSCENPSLALIKKYIHLLRVSPNDLKIEIQIQTLKTDIVKSIKSCHEMEKLLDDLDVKIGLLVQNRMNSQAAHHNKENANPQTTNNNIKKSEKQKKDHKQSMALSSTKGLKALTKEARGRLTGYQHLFYLLQTDPRYLSDLIVTRPPGKALKFLDKFIFNLFNFGANDRDHFLLLKLLKVSLEKEIRNKILRLNDVYTADPQVLKMVVGYVRQGPGHVSLRQVLAPLVEMVVCDKDLHINTNPVELYRSYVNQMEMMSGKPSELPRNVTSEDALKHPEVQKRLASVINSLKTASKLFCDRITSSEGLLPYAIQYMTKVLGSTLANRFPHLPEKEILKVMGYLIYYRYINSAIVAPDAFDVITVTPETKLTSLQRRNLASIAKILQFAATKKGFGTEASHLMCLNQFIIELHEKFRQFFLKCTRVDDPEIVYNVDEYSEETLTIKPTVYVSLQDIVDIHKMVKANMGLIAPEESDPLHNLLSDLDENPSLACLVGDLPDNPAYIDSIGRAEICLSLSMKPLGSPKIPTQKSTKDSGLKLFNKTKQLLIDLLQCVGCDSMESLINKPSTACDERRYKDIIEARALQERTASLNETELNRGNSFLGEARVSLHEVRTRLSHNLRKLENAGLAFKHDGYQSLLNALAKEIINQRHHRASRRSEMTRLYSTFNQLRTKSKFYTDQLQSYRAYHDMCLINVTGKKRSVHANSGRKWKKTQTVLKYTGSKLFEKKILVEIEDLPVQQLKHVLFIITPESTPGVFEITVKFMGVAMETMTLDIEELLNLQYEGIALHSLKNRARVNVNLLLHLLNNKFYSKSK